MLVQDTPCDPIHPSVEPNLLCENKNLNLLRNTAPSVSVFQHLADKCWPEIALLNLRKVANESQPTFYKGKAEIAIAVVRSQFCAALSPAALICSKQLIFESGVNAKYLTLGFNSIIKSTRRSGFPF